MARPNAPAASIVLDKERHLRLDFNAIALIEDLTGKNILTEDAWKNFTGKDFRAIVYAMLAHEDANLTLEDVGGMMHLGNIEEIMQSVNKIVDQVQAQESDSPLPGQVSLTLGPLQDSTSA